MYSPQAKIWLDSTVYRFSNEVNFSLKNKYNRHMPARCATRHLWTLTRHLSDKYHIYTRHIIPHVHQTYHTTCTPDIYHMCTRHILPHVHQTYSYMYVYKENYRTRKTYSYVYKENDRTRKTSNSWPHVICLVYMWYLSDRCLVRVD